MRKFKLFSVVFLLGSLGLTTTSGSSISEAKTKNNIDTYADEYATFSDLERLTLYGGALVSPTQHELPTEMKENVKYKVTNNAVTVSTDNDYNIVWDSAAKALLIKGLQLEHNRNNAKPVLDILFKKDTIVTTNKRIRVVYEGESVLFGNYISDWGIRVQQDGKELTDDATTLKSVDFVASPAQGDHKITFKGGLSGSFFTCDVRFYGGHVVFQSTNDGSKADYIDVGLHTKKGFFIEDAIVESHGAKFGIKANPGDVVDIIKGTNASLKATGSISAFIANKSVKIHGTTKTPDQGVFMVKTLPEPFHKEGLDYNVVVDPANNQVAKTVEVTKLVIFEPGQWDGELRNQAFKKSDFTDVDALNTEIEKEIVLYRDGIVVDDNSLFATSISNLDAAEFEYGRHTVKLNAWIVVNGNIIHVIQDKEILIILYEDHSWDIEITKEFFVDKAYRTIEELQEDILASIKIMEHGKPADKSTFQTIVRGLPETITPGYYDIDIAVYDFSVNLVTKVVSHRIFLLHPIDPDNPVDTPEKEASNLITNLWICIGIPSVVIGSAVAFRINKKRKARKAA